MSWDVQPEPIEPGTQQIARLTHTYKAKVDASSAEACVDSMVVALQSAKEGLAKIPLVYSIQITAKVGDFCKVVIEAFASDENGRPFVSP
jgi:hypothetical protein